MPHDELKFIIINNNKFWGGVCSFSQSWIWWMPSTLSPATTFTDTHTEKWKEPKKKREKKTRASQFHECANCAACSCTCDDLKNLHKLPLRHLPLENHTELMAKEKTRRKKKKKDARYEEGESALDCGVGIRQLSRRQFFMHMSVCNCRSDPFSHTYQYTMATKVIN